MKMIGINLYGLRDYCRTEGDLNETLRRLKEIGYPSAQVSGVGPIPIPRIKELFDAHGLKVCACHDSFDSLRKDPASVAARLKTFECDFTALGMPPKEYMSAELLGDLISVLKKAGKLLKAEGLMLGYHNHNIEFARIDGKLALETIFEKTDPGILFSELDTYWVQAGGGNPAKWIRSLKGRLPVLHCKDYAMLDNGPRFAEVGYGNLDWDDIFAAAEEAGVQRYVVEQDLAWPDRDIFESAAMSFDFLMDRLGE
jgi:sugar phosphate isomerase/epimerase